MNTKNTTKAERVQMAETSSKEANVKKDAPVLKETDAKIAGAKMLEEATETKCEAIAYIGPDIRNVTANGTVYDNGLPKALEEKIKEIPAIKSLLVPVSEYAQSGAAVAQKGSALNRIYEAAENKLIEIAGKKEE